MDDDKTSLDEVKEENEVIEADVVDDGTSTSNVAGADVVSDPAASFLNLEELIKGHIESLDKLRDELKKKREQFEDTFTNNPTYREHVEKVKEANKAKASARKQLTNQPAVAKLEQEVKDLKFDIKENSQTLSDLLQDYKEQTGATQI